MSYNRIIIERELRKFLIEDCRFSDISAISIPEDAIVTGKIIAKSKGYISGLEELRILYNILNVSINFFVKDGEAFNPGDTLAELKGNARDILMGERTGLNLITHMSSITTTTRKYIDVIKKSGKNLKIACTRKTLPGLRIFEKRAVDLAGDLADTHRFSLDDMILLKDTHLKYYNGDVEKLLRDVKKKASFSKKIEIEIEQVDDVLIAAKSGADIIMLDNMNPDQVKLAIKLLKNNNLRNKVLIEVSGGINLENLSAYLTQDAPDIISSSELTQFPSERVDISLRFD